MDREHVSWVARISSLSSKSSPLPVQRRRDLHIRYWGSVALGLERNYRSRKDQEKKLVQKSIMCPISSASSCAEPSTSYTPEENLVLSRLEEKLALARKRLGVTRALVYFLKFD